MKKVFFFKIFMLTLFISLFCNIASAQAPVVNSFAPLYGCAGVTPVIIAGTDFTNATSVTFGGTPAQSFVVDNANQITAVPASGNTGNIAVTTPLGIGLSIGTFTIYQVPAAPTLVTATPNSICVGSSSDLNATSPGNLINWYTSPTGGVSLGSSASGVNFSVSPAVTTTYYAEADGAGPAGIPVVFNYTGLLQSYTVPPGITSLVINATGGQGGAGGSALPGSGGLGADMTGTFVVTPGQILKILVGQQGGGTPNTAGAGGGGGTFVTDNTNNPLIIAGGGGGRHGTLIPVGMDATTAANGLDGYSTPAGYPTHYGVGGVGGNGATNGPVNPHAGNGGGLLTNGAVAQCGDPGIAFISGGMGGAAICGGAGASAGGFGGGGAGGNNGGGGGGGYSGGGGSYHTPTNGGGGGSYNIGTSQINLVNNTGNGQVTITPLGGGCVSLTRTPVTVAVNTDIYPNATTVAGTLVANPAGGVPPYQYSLNGGAFTPNNTFNNLCTGPYTLTVKDNFGASGCTKDTVVSIQNIIATPLSQTACNSYFFNGNNITVTGIYMDTLISAYGCDSLIILNLTINAPVITNINQSACNSYIFNGNNITVSGNYSDTLVSAVGCDSIIQLNLTINTVNAGITQTGTTLTATAAGATYSWLNCNTNILVTGATSQSYTPSATGSFAVIVTLNGCTDTSVCKVVVISGIEDYNAKNLLSIYPNPAADVVFVESNVEFSEIVIYDAQMKMLQTLTPGKTKTAQVNTKELANGIYFFRTNNGQLRKVIINK